MTADIAIAAQSKRRIALFLDGTWNTINDNTNVWRLKALTAATGADGLHQCLFYNSGLGTQVGQKFKGGMFGVGIDDILLEAYAWLVENYNDGDDIFIFGFSRGAYTARSLSGFISKCGLLKPGAALSIKQLYDRYRNGLKPATILHLINHPPKTPTLEEQWVVKYARPVPIKFLGVFDTVGSLGVPSGFSRFRASHAFLNTGLRISNISAAHALAIDEHRADFAPTLWTRSVLLEKDALQPRTERTLDEAEQRWFVGAHANVGGGYTSDLLAQRPLAWMMTKASAHGLAFREQIDQFPDSLTAPVIDSYGNFLGGLYRMISPQFNRDIGADPVTSSDEIESTINETIDKSVFDRWGADAAYRPVGLVTWAERRGVDMTTIKQSIRADTPTVQVPD